MAKKFLFVILALIALVFAAVVRAQDVEETFTSEEVFEDIPASEEGPTGVVDQGVSEEGTDTGLPDAHPHVSTVSIVPKFASLQVPLGETIEIVCGFRNRAAHPLNITRITGSLNFAQDFRYYIQNFSMMEFGNTLVPAGAEVSLAYPVRPDPQLEPRDFQIAATVWYEDPDTRDVYASTFFNSTVELLEAESTFDTSLLFGTVTALAVIGGLGFIVFRFLSSRKGSKRAPKLETGSKDVVEHDFISDSAVLGKGGKSPARSKTPVKKTVKEE